MDTMGVRAGTSGNELPRAGHPAEPDQKDDPAGSGIPEHQRVFVLIDHDLLVPGYGSLQDHL